jgi:light-regulated signal transduction histidine kinase (bacteriophytochrome)
MAEVISELQEMEPERKVDRKIQPGLRALGDEHLLRIVFVNLCSNAWKFTSNKEQALIEFGCLHQEEHPVYFIRDNGVGFNMAYANKLFGTFQRLHSSKDFEGTGIGLATVKRIVLRHGGRIWAEGMETQGATFYFTIGERPSS